MEQSSREGMIFRCSARWFSNKTKTNFNPRAITRRYYYTDYALKNQDRRMTKIQTKKQAGIGKKFASPIDSGETI